MTEATPPGQDAIGGGSSVTPFSLAVSDAEVGDLRRRLQATRWPDPATVEDWSQAVPLPYLRQVCRYWGTDYDWPARQARLNEVEQFAPTWTGWPSTCCTYARRSRRPCRWYSPTAGPARCGSSWTGAVALPGVGAAEIVNQGWSDRHDQFVEGSRDP
jgi:epoxide hydrolase-like protein